MVHIFRGSRLLPVALCFIMLAVLTATASACSDGDSDGGTAGASTGNETASTKSLSRQDLEKIFSLLHDKRTETTFVNAFQGTNMSKREILDIRQRLLVSWQKGANNYATFMRGATWVVETTDTVGKHTQTVLSFVPGVGLVTSTSLGAARAAAEEYKKGKEGWDIVKAGTFNAVANVTVSKLSPLGADKIFSKVSRAGKLMKGAVSEKAASKAADIFSKNAMKYTAAKYAEKKAGDFIENSLKGEPKKSVTNYVPTPSYSPGGWAQTYVK